MTVFLFTATPAAYGGSQAEVKSEPQLPVYTAATATYAAACSNAGSLTH